MGSFVDRWMEEFRWNPVKEGRLGILFRRQMQPEKMKDRLGLELPRTCNPKKGIVGKQKQVRKTQWLRESVKLIWESFCIFS